MNRAVGLDLRLQAACCLPEQVSLSLPIVCEALRVGKAAASDRGYLISNLPFSACCWYDNKHTPSTSQRLSLCRITLHPGAIALVTFKSIERQEDGLACPQQNGINVPECLSKKMTIGRDLASSSIGCN